MIIENLKYSKTHVNSKSRFLSSRIIQNIFELPKLMFTQHTSFELKLLTQIIS